MPKLTEVEILWLEEDLDDLNIMIDSIWLDDLVTLKDLCKKKQRILNKLGRLNVKEKSGSKFVDWEF
jgi:hypothetical protein